MLGIGCFILAVTEGIYQLIKDFAINYPANYHCVGSLFYKPITSVASGLNFFDDIIDVAGTVVLWYILYRIPNKRGRISKLRVRDTVSIDTAALIDLDDEDDEEYGRINGSGVFAEAHSPDKRQTNESDISEFTR